MVQEPGLGRGEPGIQRRAAPRCTDSIGFLLAALSGGAGPFTPRLTILSLSLSSSRRCFRFLLAVQSRALSGSLTLASIFLLAILRPLPLRRASCSRNETEEKEDTAGGFRRGGRRDASEIKHLFKWQPFLNAHHRVYWHLIRALRVREHTRVCDRAEKRGG